MAIGIVANWDEHVLHDGAPRVVGGYFGSREGRHTDLPLRVLALEEVRASLGDDIEELVVVYFRKLAAALYLRVEKKKPEVERQLFRLVDAVLQPL